MTSDEAAEAIEELNLPVLSAEQAEAYLQYVVTQAHQLHAEVTIWISNPHGARLGISCKPWSDEDD